MAYGSQSQQLRQSPELAKKDFLFINANHPNDVGKKSTQRSLRSKAIKHGIRARKTRNKRAVNAVTFALEEVPVAENGDNRGQLVLESKLIPKSVDYWPFPIERHTRAHELIYFMTAESDYVFRPFRTVWFSMARIDESAMQLCLANAAMFMAQRKDLEFFKYEKCSEALEYYGQSLRHVTKRLESRSDRTSDGVIVTVLGFICHDLYVGVWDRWVAHIQGLRRIIQLRGYKNIEADLVLWASWYDILGSATLDAYPQFPDYMCSVDPCSSPTLLQAPLVLKRMCDNLSKDSISMQPVLDAFEKIQEIASIANSRYQDSDFWRREDDLSPLYMIGPVTHKLLSIPRLDMDDEYQSFEMVEVFREMARLTMLILLSALKRRYSFTSDELELELLTTKFSKLLTIYPPGCSLYLTEEAMYDFQLWALYTVASLQQPFSPAFMLCILDIRTCMDLLGIESATEALQRARNILWIDVIGGTHFQNETLVNAIDSAAPI